MRPFKKANALLRTLGLLPAALLLLSLLAGAVHHHGFEDHSDRCVVCGLSHAPAVPTVASAGNAPAIHREPVAVVPALEPPAVHSPSPSSRAPPSL